MSFGGGDDGDLLTIPETADLLRVSTVTISRWLKQGRLPAQRVGPRAVRIRRGDLASVMAPARGRPSAFAAQATARPSQRAASGVESAGSTGDALQALMDAQELRQSILGRRRGELLSADSGKSRKGRGKRS